MIKDIERLENESQARMTTHYSDGNHVSIIDEERLNLQLSKAWRGFLVWVLLCNLLTLVGAVYFQSWAIAAAFAINSVMAYYGSYRVMRYRKEGYYGRTGTEA